VTLGEMLVADTVFKILEVGTKFWQQKSSRKKLENLEPRNAW